MTRILLTLGATGFYWAFGSLAYANITDDFAVALDPMWWGFLAMVVAGWLYTIKLIWELP